MTIVKFGLWISEGTVNIPLEFGWFQWHREIEFLFHFSFESVPSYKSIFSKFELEIRVIIDRLFLNRLILGILYEFSSQKIAWNFLFLKWQCGCVKITDVIRHAPCRQGDRQQKLVVHLDFVTDEAPEILDDWFDAVTTLVKFKNLFELWWHFNNVALFINNA